jgi:hypothetical protein
MRSILNELISGFEEGALSRRQVREVPQAIAFYQDVFGLKTEENLDYGFFVRDPEGYPVQIVAG